MSHINQSETIVTDSIERYGASIRVGGETYTRIHAWVIMESQNYYNLLLYQLWSWVMGNHGVSKLLQSTSVPIMELGDG